MPASQKTTNYELPIYASDDVTSYLDDFNPAMTKIDTQMKANADAAAAAQSDADNLDTRVTALENAPAGVTELDANTDVSGFTNGYVLYNNNGKLGAKIVEAGGGDDPNAIHADGGGTFTADPSIGSGPFTIEVDEEAGVMDVTADEVVLPSTSTAYPGDTVTEAIEHLYEGQEGGKAAENVSYSNTESGLTATNVQDAIDEVKERTIIADVFWRTTGLATNGIPYRTVFSENQRQIYAILPVFNKTSIESGTNIYVRVYGEYSNMNILTGYVIAPTLNNIINSLQGINDNHSKTSSLFHFDSSSFINSIENGDILMLLISVS